MNDLFRALNDAPPKDAYMALAEALHDEDDVCNAGYVVRFDACATHEYDVLRAITVLIALGKDGWRLVRDGQGTVEMFRPDETAARCTCSQSWDAKHAPGCLLFEDVRGWDDTRAAV
jgi:hypothetical protein